MTQPYNILFLADTTHPTMAVSDHINAIKHNSPHHWFVENTLTCKVLHKIDLNQFDAIGFHYSIRPHHDYYINKQLLKKIKAFKGLKFIFLQDEYRYAKRAEQHILDLNIQLLFTLVKEELWDKAYPKLKNITKMSILTGYVPDALLNISVPPIKERELDIFYRSRPCEYWYGTLGQDKSRICNGVKKAALPYPLKIDLSVKEEDRVYGDAWISKLKSAKTVLATESGTSIWDYEGQVEKETNAFLRKNPEATFEEAYNAFLKNYDENLPYNAISPRIFEAAALKAALVMFPGWYNGVCIPHKHYIPLEKDFSNFAEVVEKLQDDNYLQELVDNTYRDLIASGDYAESVLASLVNTAVEKLIPTTQKTSSHIEKNTIEKCLAVTKQKYVALNSFYILQDEMKLVIRNVYIILFDRRYTFKSKFITLYKSAQRYFEYLAPRFSRKT